MIGRSDADDETFRTHQTVWVPLDRLTRHTQYLHLSLIHGQNGKRALNEHSFSRQLLPKSAHRQRGKIGQELLMT